MTQEALKLEAKGEWLSKSQIAKRCKIDRTVCGRRLEDLGYEPDEERSTPNNQVYWFDDEVEFAIKSAKDSLAAAKIRDLRATYELKELKLAEARGELVNYAKTVEIVQAIIVKMYKEVALAMPKRVGPRAAKAKSAAEATKIIKAEVEKVFARLRENDGEFVK